MYEKMKKELLEAVKDTLADSFKIKTFTVFKNGKETEAFLITEEDSAVSPTFYFKDYLDDYRNGISVEKLATEIVATYFFAVQQVPARVNVNSFKDFNTQKEGIVYRVVNAEQYATQLPTLPHLDFFDLAIIFYCVISANEEGFMSYVITNDTLEAWGISKETLFETAHQNLPKVLPLEIISITQAILNDFDSKSTMEEAVSNLPDDFMYVITNKYKKYGFANIFYPRLFKTFAEKFGSFYILPSSVEEAIFVPISANDNVDEIKQIVKQVNKTELLPDQFLSNSIYLYDAETGKINAYL